MKTTAMYLVQMVLVCLVLLGLSASHPAMAADGNISDTDKYGWSENGGWLNFRPIHGGVTVHDTHLSGYGWAENIGWVKLGVDVGGPYSNTNVSDWGVNHDGSGNLSGYGWSENAGWISFSCANTTSCTTVDHGVSVDPATGEFSGYGWGENVGWVSFSCENTSSCGTVNYKVTSSLNTFTVSMDGTGTGTVTGSPGGIDCGTVCTADYFSDAPVTLTASAYADSAFMGWSGGGCSGTGTCQVSMDQSKTVTATFDSSSLTVIKVGSGSGTITSTSPGIDCGSDCQDAYPPGTVVTLTATAENRSIFAGWSGGGCSSTGDCTLSLDTSKTVTAIFYGGEGDADNDNVPDYKEQGPDGDDPSYDGNRDGIADYRQRNVVSFTTYTDEGKHYLTLASHAHHYFAYAYGRRNFDSEPPQWVSLPFGYFTFKLRGVTPGGSATVTLYLDGESPQTYYKYGPTPENPRDHWYEFDFDGSTGTEKDGRAAILLHLMDGGRGDHDLVANGEILDPGGPAAIESRDVLYFPYLDRTEESETGLGIISGESYEVSASISFYGEEGELLENVPMSLAGKAKLSLADWQIPFGAASAVVYADGYLAGYSRYVSPEGKRCAWPAARKLSTSIAVPHCATGSGWETGLSLFNPGEQEALASISLDSGGLLDVVLGPKARELIWLDGTENGTRIIATERIAVMELFESLAPEGDMAAVLLESQYLSSLYVPCISYEPESFTGAGIFTGYWDSTASVYGYKADGEIEEVSLGPLSCQGQITVDLSNLFADDTLCAEISGEVDVVTPMGTPLALYQGLVSYAEEGTARLGAVKLNALMFTEGFLGVVASDPEATFGLVNPGTEDATVMVTARKRDGTVLLSTTLTIPAGTNLTGPISELIGNLALPHGSHIQLQSDVRLYGLEMIYSDGRMEVLPVLVTK